jgi:hypothetical protein
MNILEIIGWAVGMALLAGFITVLCSLDDDWNDEHH